jgi:hypothetical protein
MNGFTERVAAARTVECAIFPFFFGILFQKVKFVRILCVLTEKCSLRKLSFVLFLLLALAPLFAQESVPDEAEVEQEEAAAITQDPPPPPDEGRIYVITDFEFDITGRTLPFALLLKGEFKKGERIQGDTDLEKYIQDKTQMLTNQRVLKDTVEIGYSVGEQAPDGAYPVTLTIKVEDTRNIIALPYPKYDSNTGFELYIKARDYNFFGTMTPLRVDIGYVYDENYRSSFSLGIYSNIPFEAFGYNWNIVFDNFFSYRQQVEEPFYYQNNSGISVELPFRDTTFTFGFNEYLNVNEENPDEYKEEYGNFQSGFFMTSRPYASWKIPTGFEVGQYGELAYITLISATFTHGFSKWPLAKFRKGPSIGFAHSFGFEKIDWHSNYREGFSVSLSNSYDYNFYTQRNGGQPVSTYYGFNGTGHFIISDWFGISSRLLYRQWFNSTNDQAGDVIRGIPDRAMCADLMLSLNMDFPFRVLLFTPSKWFNKEKLAFFDLELQISPVIDLALYHDPKAGISFNPKNIVAGGGIEFIVFPASFRNLYACLSFTLNLREFATARPVRFPDGNNREITFGIGHFY